MGRTGPILWHGVLSIIAGVLFFFFVLPRWPEFMGDTSHGLGTVLRIVSGALIGLAALPVVFDLQRAGRAELRNPDVALRLRLVAIVMHLLAAVLIVGAAISEIWLSLDSFGPWLFGVYGAAAAIALLGIFSFYLAFVAELPPPPPSPISAASAKRRRGKGSDAADGPEVTAVAAGDPESEVTAEVPEDSDSDGDLAPAGGLRNRRPSGKGIRRMGRSSD